MQPTERSHHRCRAATLENQPENADTGRENTRLLVTSTASRPKRPLLRWAALASTFAVVAAGSVLGVATGSAQATTTLNAAPTRTIQGGNTGLVRPYQGRFDSQGNLYVPDRDAGKITVFSASSLTGTGTLNIAPLRVVSGSNTQLAEPTAVAFDADGNLYVQGQNTVNILAFRASDLTGTGTLDIAPFRVIPNGSPAGNPSNGSLAFDSTGNLYALRGSDTGTEIAVVRFAASQLTGTGTLSLTPDLTITGSNTGLNRASGVAFDGLGNFYVSNLGVNTVQVFDASMLGATGSQNLSPSRAITGGNTGINRAWAIIPGPDGNLYLPNESSPSVTRYLAAEATGSGNLNLEPGAILTGAQTALSTPVGIGFDAAGTLYASNFGSASITAYADFANTAPAITSSSSVSATVGQAMTPFTVVTTGYPRPTISVTSGALPAGVVITDNGDGTATISGTPSTTGDFALALTATNGAPPDATQSFTFTVSKADQTISFPALPDTAFTSTTPTPAATATSGLPVTYTSLTTSVCTTTSGGTIALVATSVCTIAADQTGNSTFNAAAQTTRSFTVTPGTALTPVIATPTGTADGFTTQVTNHDPAFTWGVTSDQGTATIDGTGLITVTIAFDPADANGSAITAYTVTANPGGVTCTPNAPFSPPLQCQIAGLTRGTAFTFAVTATNAIGTGPAGTSSPVNSADPLPDSAGQPWAALPDGTNPPRRVGPGIAFPVLSEDDIETGTTLRSLTPGVCQVRDSRVFALRKGRCRIKQTTGTVATTRTIRVGGNPAAATGQIGIAPVTSLYFRPDSATLTRKLQQQLTRAARAIGNRDVIVTGNAHDAGTGSADWQLSHRRATNTAHQLEILGIDQVTILTHAYGSTQNGSNPRSNRRVDIYAIG